MFCQPKGAWCSVNPKGHDALSTQRGLMLCQPKGVWCSVNPQGSDALSTQRDLMLCQPKGARCSVNPKGHDALSTQRGLMLCHPKGVSQSKSRLRCQPKRTSFAVNWKGSHSHYNVGFNIGYSSNSWTVPSGKWGGGHTSCSLSLHFIFISMCLLSVWTWSFLQIMVTIGILCMQDVWRENAKGLSR